MADSQIDFKLIAAKEYIANQSHQKAGELLKYLIDHKDGIIDKQNKQLEEYREFFRTLDRLLPNNFYRLRQGMKNHLKEMVDATSTIASLTAHYYFELQKMGVGSNESLQLTIAYQTSVLAMTNKNDNPSDESE